MESCVTSASNSGNSKLEKIKELDSYFCSLLDTIPPDVYFGKLIQSTASNEVFSNETNQHGKGSGSSKTLQTGRESKSKMFRHPIDGSMMTVTEAFSSGIIEKLMKKQKSPISGNFQDEGKKQVLLGKLHAKLASSQRKESSKGKKKSKAERRKEQLKSKKKVKHNVVKADSSKKLRQETDSVVDNDTSKHSGSGKMTFSKFSVVSSSLTDTLTDKSKLKKKKDISKRGNKYDNLIKLAEKKQKSIDELKEADPKKAKEKIKEESWCSAVQKAQGVKVKDDVQLLKKAAKQRKKQKEKNAKAWEKRVQDKTARMDERKRKRSVNIRNKKLEKLQKKKRKDAKKGRIFVDVNN